MSSDAGATPLGRTVAELTDPFSLEVHPAITANAALGLPALPAYINREHDMRLREATERAVAGCSAMVVLIGDSSTGKTRACWEAIQALPPPWRVWHPLDPSPAEALTNGLTGIGPRTVLWLNDSQQYLLTPSSPLGERIAAGLRELLRSAERAPVLVLGSLWHEYWNILTRIVQPGQGDPHAQARALLASPGAGVVVADRFTGSALDAVRASRDPRLTEALARAEHGQITQYLAGAPAVLARYRAAPPPVRALINIAIDARRLGHQQGVSLALLEAAVGGYLTDQQYDELDENWLSLAVDYATDALQCRGARAPLSRIRPRPGDVPGDQPHYRLSDYLEQVGRSERRNTSVPPSLWDALVLHAAREDLPKLVYEAHTRALYRHAVLLSEATTAAGRDAGLPAHLMEVASGSKKAIMTYHSKTMIDHSPGSIRVVGWSVEDTLAWQQSFVDDGEDGALLMVAGLLKAEGRNEEALDAYLRAVEAGVDGALEATAHLLWQTGQRQKAFAWLRMRADNGYARALTLIARLLQKERNLGEAIAYCRRAVDAGDSLAMWLMARLMRAQGHTESALRQYLCAVEAGGNSNAMGELIDLLYELGRVDEAVRAARFGLEPGGRIAVSWGRATGYEPATREFRQAPDRAQNDLILDQENALRFFGAGSGWQGPRHSDSSANSSNSPAPAQITNLRWEDKRGPDHDSRAPWRTES